MPIWEITMTGKVLNDLQVEMEMEIAMLREQNEMLKAAMANGKGNGIKVSAKGAVSVYGLGRFPVTLYASQWHKLFSKANEINDFIHENKAKLSVKGND